MILLSGCAKGGSDADPGPCPPVVAYSRTDQTRAAAEVEALPEGAMVITMFIDYAVLREQVRACNS